MKLHHKLLTTEQLRVAAEKLHKVRVRRVIFASIFLAAGFGLAEMHPHMLLLVIAETFKGIGLAPALKLVEEML